MRRFRFPLERLLRLRVQEEREIRRALTVARVELADVDARMVTATESMRACEPDQQPGSRTAPLARALHAGFAHSLHALSIERTAAEATVTRLLAVFEVRRRERETLSRLRVRRRSEWEEQCKREEQNEIDELGRLRAAARARDRRVSTS